MPFFKTQGISLYYEIRKARSLNQDPIPIIFLHGAGGNSASWFNQFAFFSEKFDCIAPDQRGFGRSKSIMSNLTVEQFSNDLIALLDHFKTPKVHLVGQSMGGYTALRCALDAPERVKSLILSCSNGMIDHRDDPSLTPGFDVIKKCNENNMPWGWSKKSQKNLQLIELYGVIQNFNQNIISGQNVFQRRCIDLIELKDLKKVKCPTLILSGQDDPLFPEKLMNKCASLFPNGHHIMLEGVGHSPYFENPKAFNKVLLDHITST
tara:strand:+ start:318 stop:1109 length:792 start_codon:yes stop_codon:yes gene_type:complete